MGKGWICLHREIQDSWLWNADPYSKAQAWIDLLLTANHMDRKIYVNGSLQLIKRGQFLTSERKLAERWKWSRPKVKRFLDTLVSDEMITYECSSNVTTNVTTNDTTNGTTITIVNYDKFQDVRSANVTTNDTTNVTTNVTTVEPPTIPPTLPRSCTNNNYNNYNNVEQISTPYSDGTTFLPQKGDRAYKDVKLTQFHNMETNKYDFDALEKYLLERDRPSEMS